MASYFTINISEWGTKKQHSRVINKTDRKPATNDLVSIMLGYEKLAPVERLVRSLLHV